MTEKQVKQKAIKAVVETLRPVLVGDTRSRLAAWALNNRRALREDCTT